MKPAPGPCMNPHRCRRERVCGELPTIPWALREISRCISPHVRACCGPHFPSSIPTHFILGPMYLVRVPSNKSNCSQAATHTSWVVWSDCKAGFIINKASLKRDANHCRALLGSIQGATSSGGISGETVRSFYYPAKLALMGENG